MQNENVSQIIADLREKHEAELAALHSKYEAQIADLKLGHEIKCEDCAELASKELDKKELDKITEPICNECDSMTEELNEFLSMVQLSNCAESIADLLETVDFEINMYNAKRLLEIIQNHAVIFKNNDSVRNVIVALIESRYSIQEILEFVDYNNFDDYESLAEYYIENVSYYAHRVDSIALAKELLNPHINTFEHDFETAKTRYIVNK